MQETPRSYDICEWKQDEIKRQKLIRNIKKNNLPPPFTAKLSMSPTPKLNQSRNSTAAHQEYKLLSREQTP